MAEIYSVDNTQVYDNAGKTFNAKTGTEYVSPMKNPNAALQTPGLMGSGNPLPPPPKAQKTSEPTTLYSGNIQEKVIPKLNNRLKNLESGGTYVGIDGNQYYSADGSPVSAPIGAESTGAGWSAGGQSYKDGPAYVGGDDPESQKQNELLQSMKANLDATTLSLIRSIEQQSQVRKAQQADINKSLEAGTEQALLLGGSARYAPVSSNGIAAAQETYGLQQIAALDAQEKQLVAKARQAQSDGNYKIMGDALNLAETKRKEKQAEAKKLSDMKAAEIQSVREQQRAASRDGAIAELIGQGVTDPSQLLDYLNYDQAGNMVGDFNAEEITKTLKLLTVDSKATEPKKIAEDFKTDIGSFNYFRDNNMLPKGIAKLDPSEQYFAYLNMQKLANSGKLSQAAEKYGGGGDYGKGIIPGAGAKNGVEEQLVRDSLFRRMVPLFNKGVLSNEDRDIIEGKVAFYRNNGISESELLAYFAGFPVDLKSPYKNRMSDIITATTANADEQNELVSKVSTLLRRDAAPAAVRLVENAALSKAIGQGVLNKDSFVTEDDVIYVRDKVKSINELLGGDWVNSVGAFTGTLNQWLSKKFGIMKAAQLKSKLTSLTADMIHKRGGSAITDSEWKRLVEPSVPSMNESATTWRTKLQELQGNALERYNAGREVSVLPTITMEQLDPSKRLKLYESETQTTDEDFWGGTGASGSSVIYNKDAGYVIPTE